MDKFAVIMAGGSGTRLWPLSREVKPKQFININDGNCMLIQTIQRICEIVPADKCFIVTNKELLDITWNTVKDIIPYSNLLLEPEKKNTAACIAFATLLLKERFGEGIVCFIPADGYVKEHKPYKEAIELAFTVAEKNDDLVIIGIAPAYPATGYGYIQIDNENEAEKVLTVLRFIEKPDLETAKKLISTGEYLWNSGILAGSMDSIIRSLTEYLPEHYIKIYEAIKHVNEENGNTYIEKAYNEIQNISFDTGILEKCNNVYVVKGLFDWDDIGCIDALSKTMASDADGNAIKGEYLGVDTFNSVIVGEDKLIVTMSVDNLIVVSTKDVILVCPRNKAQDIKKVVEKLRGNGYKSLL
ncbi:mannose-1-phosphate guanylyltransferase [Ruminiclostridium sufflavum DSM 19573]|uniref:Mannose-1-phosphate guanylyltransferase n=1 Tax=Ruminiclostridium sufflavum DSM 19573 TaxID=1121337 RepID=A0A318XGD3_9FIRM|nr:mannose-1-phosphate guanylyltransferase [Ruminiclostridium sufflavum]PYG85002.1 mannose-1-phosphate guanylyltransferase [Ruminiclostridium sufflavum DSM 19573]